MNSYIVHYYLLITIVINAADGAISLHMHVRQAQVSTYIPYTCIYVYAQVFHPDTGTQRSESLALEA